MRDAPIPPQWPGEPARDRSWGAESSPEFPRHDDVFASIKGNYPYITTDRAKNGLVLRPRLVEIDDVPGRVYQSWEFEMRLISPRRTDGRLAKGHASGSVRNLRESVLRIDMNHKIPWM